MMSQPTSFMSWDGPCVLGHHFVSWDRAVSQDTTVTSDFWSVLRHDFTHHYRCVVRHAFLPQHTISNFQTVIARSHTGKMWIRFRSERCAYRRPRAVRAARLCCALFHVLCFCSHVSCDLLFHSPIHRPGFKWSTAISLSQASPTHPIWPFEEEMGSDFI